LPDKLNNDNIQDLTYEERAAKTDKIGCDQVLKTVQKVVLLI